MREEILAMKENRVRCRTLATALFFLICLHTGAQTAQQYTHASQAEKIYLQLDGKVYTTDRIIWFKAVVVRALDHSPGQVSGVLYAELVGPDERILEKKLIQLKNGIGSGHFQLNTSYREGTYQVRAYTEWNKNFGADFIFTEYIRLFDCTTIPREAPIGKITLAMDPVKGRRLLASLNPYSIDSLHKRDVTAIITLDERRDTLQIKRNRENKYLLDYPVTDDCGIVTLQMQTSNSESYAKTIALDEDRFDLQFFPESGELVCGLKSKVGFKALDYNGKGKTVEGEIVTMEGEVVARFKSNRLGMGSFLLPDVQAGAGYFARLASGTDQNLTLLFPLPKAAVKGNVMTVFRYRDELRIKLTSNYLVDDSIQLKVIWRGAVCFNIREHLKNGSVVFSWKSDELPEGVLAFTLADNNGLPLAERLCFNEVPGNRLQLSLSADKDSYAQRELTRLKLEARDSKGEAVPANFSVLVLNKAELGALQQSRRNILTTLLLTSDLKGEIEDPGYYFNGNPVSYNELDALMLTQGWRRYKYTIPREPVTSQPEPELTVSGTVSGILKKSRKKLAEVTMMTFGRNHALYHQYTDSLGHFSFSLGEEYGQNLNVLIQSSNKSGQNKNYTISLDRKTAPPVSFNHAGAVEKADSVVQILVKKNIERKTVDDTYKLSAGEILLGEVVVETYKMTPERKKVMEKYGKPDEVISGKAIQDKEEKWSYGLYSVLMAQFPDKLIVRRARDGNLYARVSQSEITLVVIDGIPARPYEYPLIPNIPPSEVKSLEIIENAHNFSSLYLELFPMVTNPPPWGDIIAIYTHAGHGIYGAKSPTGIVQAAVPVFDVKREFYSPSYENIQPSDWYKPDLRALIHWVPELQTDRTGNASVNFYNADHTGDVMVVVEAISETGAIGYRELSYPVRKAVQGK